jgi:hypothetical protein
MATTPARMTRDRARHGRTSLSPAIHQWLLKAFGWTKTADYTLETLAAYCQRIVYSGH